MTFNKHYFKCIINVLLFTTLLCLIVCWLQNHSHNEAERYQIERFYHEDQNSLNAIILGSSHPYRGISPMELYNNYGISCYDLTSSAQSVMTSYYAIKEALKTQSPELIIIDADSLYEPVSRESAHKYVLDGMHLDSVKIDYAYHLSEYFLAEESSTPPNFSSVISSDSFIGTLFPVIRYHTEVSKMTKAEFVSLPQNMRSYSRGFLIDADVVASDASVDEMNRLYDSTYNDADIAIPEINAEYALKIKQLCNDRGINLLFIKVPSYGIPDGQKTFWVNNKYTATRQFCDENNISYIDFLYEQDIGLDSDNDFLDGGLHLNFRGAIKMSAALGDYLISNYEFASINHTDTWKTDEDIYEKIRQVALLASETDLPSYQSMLENLTGFEVQSNSIDDTIYYLVTDPVSGCTIDNVRFTRSSSDFQCVRDGIDSEGIDHGSVSFNLHEYENYLIDSSY